MSAVHLVNIYISLNWWRQKELRPVLLGGIANLTMGEFGF
jgi:hypothetical protein